MLNRYSPYSKKYNQTKIYKSIQIEDTTGSLSLIIKPSDKKYITGTKTFPTTTKIVKEQKTISTASLENIVEPSETNYITGIKSSPTERTFISTTNIINDFHQEILQYSARYVKKHIDWYDEENNTITLANTLLDYGTEGPTAENFEVIINGLHSPQIYTINQDGNNILIQFSERLFSYDGLQKENVIIIGKLLDIALLTEQNDIIITDENGEALIL